MNLLEFQSSVEIFESSLKIKFLTSRLQAHADMLNTAIGIIDLAVNKFH